MSACKIKRNLANIVCNEDKNCSSEVNSKLAALLAAREKQDKDINKVMTEKEYEEKYGKQPLGDSKTK
jgi:hypothetical protein